MIEYKGLPIFGDDSNPRNTSKFLGFTGTFIVWFIFLLCMIIIRPAEKEQKKYKDVQIVFEALPPLPEPPPEPEPEPVTQETLPEEIIPVENQVVENVEIEEAVIKVPEHVEQKQEKIVEHKTEPVKKQPEKKKELAKKDSDIKPVPKKEKVPEPIKQPENPLPKETRKEGEKLQPDMTNPVFPERNETITNKEPFDWSMFDDEPVVKNEQEKNNVKVKTESKVEGSAGIVAAPEQLNNTGGKSSHVDSGNNPAFTEASGKTKGVLSGIKNVKIAGDGGNSEITFDGGSDYGGYFMSMEGDGNDNTRKRGLISPTEPSITLSAEAISDIKVTVSVTVSFIVLPDGTVAEIDISPAAILPPSVVEEIKRQVKSWKFSSSDFKSNGEFKYTIKVK